MTQVMETEAFLEHYGVKGMKWGIRKEDDTGSTRSRLTPEQKALAKKVAIGTGVLLVAAGAAYVGYSMRQSASLSASSAAAKAVSEAGKKAAEKVLKEPTDIIHAARGKEVGFQFLKKGGVPDPFQEYTRAGFTAEGGGEIFQRYGGAAEKVAARFQDPDGRRDWTGRPIQHEVIIPKTMSEGIESLEDVKTKIWPLLKDQFDPFYSSPKERH